MNRQAAPTVVHAIAAWAGSTPELEAIADTDPSGAWVRWTWSAYWREIRRVAKALIAVGHAPGDAVAIMAANRREWVTAQFGAMAAGGVPAPIYPTSTDAQTSHILRNCGAKVAFTDDPGCASRMLAASESGAPIDTVVAMIPFDHEDSRVTPLETFLALGDAVSDADLDARIDGLDPNATALLIYTSGTTGEPKGAQLSHANLQFMGGAMADAVPKEEFTEAKVVSYLPLSHIAEQLFTNLVTIQTGGHVTFCHDLKAIKDHLEVARPNVFLGVPRVWEKFETALRARLGEATGLKAWIADWALRTELAAFREENATGVPLVSRRRRLANHLVQSKIKSALGLENVRLACSGAAPIGMSTLEFFASLGIVIHEGYGMTETTGIATMPPVGRPKFGTVGKAVPGVEVRIADDGEVVMRGPNMTAGYLHQADKTAELIDDDGWLHTGDLGELDREGFLKITGRKKDILITAGGKNVAPAEMESYIQAIPGVGQAVVVGDRQPYLTALIVLDPDATADLAARAGAASPSIDALARDPKVSAWIMGEVETRCNANVARYQTIKKISILPDQFSVDGGELTPSLKVKRNVVASKYAAAIEAMYA